MRSSKGRSHTLQEAQDSEDQKAARGEEKRLEQVNATLRGHCENALASVLEGAEDLALEEAEYIREVFEVLKRELVDVTALFSEQSISATRQRLKAQAAALCAAKL